ncbi:MAG: acyl-CoA thioesterase [Tractidigestivibacter sp.]|jgi:acyl-CoA hydrolase|uniref:acyl-CoA thioesterase n=1 Tax=Tractidigestivibacter sp. TaxID=2847320 RepID=UPI003D94B6D5
MAEKRHYKAMKTPSDSMVTVTKTVHYEDINGINRLFGGRLMEWIDDAAGVASRRHCGCAVTTACVDQLVFKRPVLLNDIITIHAQVTHVGRTSMEVRVETYVENVADGSRALVNMAYLTEVCMDKSGKPTPVEYGLLLTTDEERAENEAAKKRIVFRKTRKAEGF